MIRLALTGTDTGVGKTLVATALLAMLRARGLRVAAMKPFDAGVEEDDGSSSDAEVLRAAAGENDALEVVRPIAIADPAAPLAALRQSGAQLDLMKVDDAFATLCDGRDAIVVEGAGGLLGPITQSLSFDDLFAAWELDVVIIAANRMGAINAVRLTERAARTAGLRVRGVVLNAVSRDGGGATGRTNRDALADLLPGVPIVAFPWVRSVQDLEQLGRAAERHGLGALLPELPARDASAFATPLASASIVSAPVTPSASATVSTLVAAAPPPPVSSGTLAAAVPPAPEPKPTVAPVVSARPRAAPAASRARPDPVDEAFAAASPMPAAPAKPPSPARVARATPGGTPRHFDEDDPRAPDESRSTASRGRTSKPAREERPASRAEPPRATSSPRAPDSRVAESRVAEPRIAEPRIAEPRMSEARSAASAEAPAGPVSDDDAAKAMDRLLAARALRATPPESAPAVTATPSAGRPSASRAAAPSPSVSEAPRVTATAPPRPTSASPAPTPHAPAPHAPAHSAPAHPAPAPPRPAPAPVRMEQPPAAPPRMETRPGETSAPPVTVFRADGGHSFVLADDGPDEELDADEAAPLPRSGPLRHGPPPPPPAPRTRGPMRGAPAGAPVLLQPADASDRLARLDPASGRVQMVFLRDLPADAPVVPAGEYAMVEDTMICVYRAGDRLFVNIGERRVEITDAIESRIVRGGRRGLRRLLPGGSKPNVFQLLRGRTVVVTFSYSADDAALPLMTSALTQHLADETEWDFLARLHHILSAPERRRRFPGA